ncbi:hypothetical protein [Streptomyces sp. URMC 125]|uniref:hypothetical protein n=1 Tax=Streptomyces sp. URMC 125 TaxID=3423419 RepID=UPI003F1948B8
MACPPVDPDCPADRTAFVLGGAAPARLVTLGGLAARMPGGTVPSAVLDEDCTVRALAAESCGDLAGADRTGA